MQPFCVAVAVAVNEDLLQIESHPEDFSCTRTNTEIYTQSYKSLHHLLNTAIFPLAPHVHVN